MAVEFVAAGAFTSSADALTVEWPGTQSAGDVALLLVESIYTDTVSVSGWTEVSASPQGNSANAHKLSVFYKIVGSSESSVSIADPGNHGSAQILVFSGVDATTQIDAVGGYSSTTSDASLTLPAVTTTVAGCGLVFIAGTGRDASSTAQFSGWSNGNLESITEIADALTGIAGGGGFGAAWGILTAAGDSGTCAVTQAVSAIWSGITVALKPASAGGAITGTLSGTLGDATSSASATLAIAGATAATLGAATLSATGSLAVTGSGTLTRTLDDANLVGTGKLAIAGASSKTLDAAMVTASGVLVVPGGGSLSVTLANATATVTGTLRIGGTSSVLLADVASSATAQISISGALAQTLDAATLYATGSEPGAGVTLSPEDIAAIADAVWAHASAVSAHATLDAILAGVTC